MGARPDLPAPRRAPFRAALFVSALTHVALIVAVATRPIREASALPAAGDTAQPPAIDLWVGDTPFVGAGRPAAAALDPAPAAPAKSPPAAAAPTPGAAPEPAADRPAREDGDPEPRSREPARPRHPRPAPEGASDAKAAPAHEGRDQASAPGGSDGKFGSEGQASVRDLGRAFTRAIPPACSADPVWRAVALGDAGKLEVSIDLDATGHLAGFTPLTKDPPGHLVSLVRRTLALLESGTFSLRPGSVSAGHQVLELGARVANVADGEEQTGGSVSLKFTYEAGRGTASFTQAGGRHVDVSVRLVRAEIAR